MSDQTIIAAISFLVGLIAVMAPVMRLNSNITRLTTVVEKLEELVKDKTDQLDKRVTKHGEELDKANAKLADHEARITNLEK